MREQIDRTSRNTRFPVRQTLGCWNNSWTFLLRVKADLSVHNKLTVGLGKISLPSGVIISYQNRGIKYNPKWYVKPPYQWLGLFVTNRTAVTWMAECDQVSSHPSNQRESSCYGHPIKCNYHPLMNSVTPQNAIPSAKCKLKLLVKCNNLFNAKCKTHTVFLWRRRPRRRENVSSGYSNVSNQNIPWLYQCLSVLSPGDGISLSSSPLLPIYKLSHAMTK